MKSIFRWLFNKQRVSQNTRSVFDDIKPGDLAIDCGANVGEVSEVLLAKGARVIAFEPNRAAFNKLREKFAGNSSFEVHKKAVWIAEKPMKLFLHENHADNPLLWSTGSSLKSEKVNVDPSNFEEVESIDLAAYIKGLDQDVKLVKIDIEGAEVEVVNKILDYDLQNRIGQILVETHERKIPGLAKPIDELKARLKSNKITNVNLNWI